MYDVYGWTIARGTLVEWMGFLLEVTLVEWCSRQKEVTLVEWL